MRAIDFTNEQVAALKTLLRFWSKEQIVLIGASALGCFIDMQWRKTYDLDISISMSAEEHASSLEMLSGWKQDLRHEQRWIAPGDVRIDIIPAGPGLLAAGEIIWPKSGNRMSLAGLRLAFMCNHLLRIENDCDLQIAGVPVIALLKMISYQDEPIERVRDLSDLANILENFLPDEDPRRFENEGFDLGLDYEETSPFYLGKEIGHLVNELEQDKINSFLNMIRNESDPNASQSRMLLEGPPSWQKDPRILLGRLDAFILGLSIGNRTKIPPTPSNS